MTDELKKLDADALELLEAALEDINLVIVRDARSQLQTQFQIDISLESLFAPIGVAKQKLMWIKNHQRHGDESSKRNAIQAVFYTLGAFAGFKESEYFAQRYAGVYWVKPLIDKQLNSHATSNVECQALLDELKSFVKNSRTVMECLELVAVSLS